MAMNAGGRGIRLRPLDIGDVLDETFQVYRRSFVPLITTMAIVLVPASLILIVASVVSGVGFGMGQSLFDRLSPEAGMALIGAGIVAVFVIVVLAIASGLAQVVASGAAIRVIASTILGQPINIRDAYREALGHLGSMLLASLCIAIPLMLLVITCLGIPVAVFLGLGWSLAFQAIMLEGRGPIESMRRSWDLVDGHRWRLLVVFILLILIQWLLLSIPSAVIAMLSASAIYLSGGNAIVQLGTQVAQMVVETAGQVLFTPVSLITATLIYYDLQIRKEAFDLQQRLPQVELAQPTGYPPYAQQPPQYPPPAPGYPPQAPGYPPYPQQPPQTPPPPPPPGYPPQGPEHPPQVPPNR